MANQRIGVMIKFPAQPGMGDALADHLRATSAITLDEPGVELWVVHKSPADPDAVWLYEVYESEAAKASHEAGPAYAEARAKTGSYLGGPPEVYPLIAISGKGIVDQSDSELRGFRIKRRLIDLFPSP